MVANQKDQVLATGNGLVQYEGLSFWRRLSAFPYQLNLNGIDDYEG